MKKKRLHNDDADSAGLRADGLLAERCAAGEPTAWKELLAQCHQPLLVSIRIMLGPQSADASLVEEIAQRVWVALAAKDGKLLTRYKPSRGRLITFLRARAKSEKNRYIRSEVCRRKCELKSLRQRPQFQGQYGTQPVDVLAEFLGTLTPHEQAFCNEHLLGGPPGVMGETYSRSNIWQLSRRIHRKLLRFLGRG